jgi:hypothetical protein
MITPLTVGPIQLPEIRMIRSVFVLSVMLISAPAARAESHRLVVQGNDRLAVVAKDGAIEREMRWGGIHDIHLLENGHLLMQKGAAAIAEVDPKTKEVVWTYDSAKQNGNAGKRVEVHSFQPLGDGRIMIAESGVGRIIEIDRDGTIQKEFNLKLNHPHPHRDTRLARKLADGHYLVCHEGDGVVREYDESGKVVWEFEVPLFGKTPRDGHGPEAFGNQTFAAVRLGNGETLISTGNGHSVIRVNRDKEIVWKLDQRELPGIVLAWVTTLEVLPNGNYVIGNCHAGPGNPLVIEIEPKTKKVVWKFDRHDDFGDSVSNTLLLDAGNASR